VKEALLYQKLKKQQVRCNLCQRRCLIPEGGIGYCKTRINKKGKLYTTIYALASAVNNDPIEKKPVFHYKPGSQCLSLGTFGCNLRCKFCQNWDISWADGIVEAERGTKISPQQAIKMAQKYHSKGIAITYNEPTVWLEYSLDVFKLAKKNNLYTVWVTNGYATKEAINVIAPYLDVYRVDLKSFDNRFYQKLTNVPKAKPIFETTKYIHQEYPQIHLECITNIIPGWNDSDKNLKQIAQWIVRNLGSKTPWHVTRFFPYAELSNLPPTPPQTLFRAREIGLKQGLQFVYIGNMEVEKEDDTICPKCGNLAVRRTGYLTEVLGVDQKGRCLDCQENLNIKR
jgi:pyruvate formate lyase activating enzyme